MQFSSVLEIQGEVYSYYGTILACKTSFGHTCELTNKYWSNIEPGKKLYEWDNFQLYIHQEMPVKTAK